MGAKKQKYYVVWNGYSPGIYTTWAECQLQIKGFPGARYKAYKTEDEAKQAFQSGPEATASRKKRPTADPKSRKDIIQESLSVDAACSSSTGKMEYRGVWTSDGVEIFRQGPFDKGTNNVGEFLALVHALAYLKKKGMGKTPVYSDSRTAMSWLRNKRIKTTLKKTAQNKILFELMDRALTWVKNNTFENEILKWDTKNWGEIPADFGRK